ncbi:MAG: flagellar export protein FliJ [Desulfobacter sp.]|nr:MAG: flagellar export protein FliJ [Desulfobacter sp.]
MKRFEFKLQSLLNYRKHLEQQARQDMARAVADVTACEKGIADMKQNRLDAEGRLDRLVEKGIPSNEFRSHYAYLSGLDQTIVSERDRKRYLEKVVAEKRKILKQRTIDKKAMERLRERRAEEYTREMLREEQKGLDEISAIKTAREALNGQS